MSNRNININEDNSAVTEDYKRGYAEAIEEIRNSMGGGYGGGPTQPPTTLPDPRLKRAPQTGSKQQQSSGGGQSGQNGQKNQKGQKGQNDQNGQNGQNSKNSKKEKEAAAKDAQDTADKAKEKAKEAAEKAAATGDPKDKEAAEKAQEEAKKAQDAADKAKQEAQNQNSDSSDEGGDDPDSWSGSDTMDDIDPDKLEGDIWDCREGVNGVLADYKGKLTGAVGDFMETVRGSHEDLEKIVEKEKRGKFVTYAKRAAEAWDVELNTILNEYITSEIEEFKREYFHTYKRHNRRQGVVTPDEVIKKGKMPKKDKIQISITFYIDKSGSMCNGKLENAFKASRAFAACIKDNNSEEIIIDDFDYTYWAFDEHFHEVKGNSIPNASSGNVGFDKILNYIHEYSLNDMVNIVITDAQFPINPKECIAAIKKTEGLFIVVANNDSNQSDFDEIEKALKGKFKFLLADNKFTVHESKLK